MEPIWVTVFADGPAGGNPCPVVFDADELTTTEMQAMAHHFGAETAFVLSTSNESDVRLRYFVPLHEMSMCVHATVASAVLLVQTGRVSANTLTAQTELGSLPVEVDRATSSAVVAQFRPAFGPPIKDIAGVLAALRVNATDLNPEIGPVQSVSTARPKLMIPLRGEAVLDGLEPDFEALWKVCDALDVTGFYPFSIEGESIAARQFPNRAGYPEDPATGVAACALGAYLTAQSTRAPGWQHWTIGQGRAMGRPSLIVAESQVDHDGSISRTRVGGPVVRGATAL